MRIYRTHFHPTDGLQSIPQWESAFNFPSGGKVRGLMLTFLDINKPLSWDYSMPSRLGYSQHKYWILLIQFIVKQNIGALAAFPFSPYLTDGLGRRPAIVFGASIMIVATILQTASHSVGMFIGAR